MAIKNTWITGDSWGASDAVDVANAVNAAYVRPGSGVPKSDLSSGVQSSLDKADTAVQATSVGQASGVAGLDSNGRVPVNQLPATLMQYVGVWSASTNVPALADGTGDIGDVYRVTVAGSKNLGSGTISFNVGDYVILNASGVWEKSDTTDAVSTVNTRVGDIVLASSDVGLGNVDNTSDATKNAAAVTLTNKTLVAPVINGVKTGFTSTATAAGSTTLTAASTAVQEFTGTANQTLVLPSTDVPAGAQYMVINNSTGSLNTLASGSGVVHTLGPSVECLFTALVATPTLPAHWEDSFYGANFAAGKVLNVNSTLTLAGTDGTVFNFPTANDTVVGIDAIQSLSNKTLVAPALGVAVSGNVAACVGQVADVSLVAFGASTARAAASYGDFPFGIRLSRAIVFSSVTFRVATADASGSLVVELRKNGSQVAGSPTTIAAASQVAGGTSTGTWSFAAGDILTVYVTGVGTTPGKGLIADIKGLSA